MYLCIRIRCQIYDTLQTTFFWLFHCLNTHKRLRYRYVKMHECSVFGFKRFGKHARILCIYIESICLIRLFSTTNYTNGVATISRIDKN